MSATRIIFLCLSLLGVAHSQQPAATPSPAKPPFDLKAPWEIVTPPPRRWVPPEVSNPKAPWEVATPKPKTDKSPYDQLLDEPKPHPGFALDNPAITQAAYEVAKGKASFWKVVAIASICAAAIIALVRIPRRIRSIDWQFASSALAAAKEHLTAVIIAAALLITVGVHSCSNRYVHTTGGKILDKWTGKTSYR